MKQVLTRNALNPVPAMMARVVLLFWVATLFMVAAPCILPAEETESPQASEDVALSLIRLLQDKGLITRGEEQMLLDRVKIKPLSETGATIPQNEFQSVKQQVEQTDKKIDQTMIDLLQRDRLAERRMEELEKKVTEEHAEKLNKSSWAQRIGISGDIRMRYQSDLKEEGNEDRFGEDGLEPTDVDRERYRYRARLNVKTVLIDPRTVNAGKVTAGLRVSTGNTNDPVSTNESLGDYSNKDSLVLDRASLDWTFKPQQPVREKYIPQISVTGGRMANPFFSTDLVWDSDLNFEGLTLNAISDTFTGNSWRVFLTGGAYPLEELEYRVKDKWLFGTQLGLEHQPVYGLKYTLAAAYYDFYNTRGQPVKRLEELSRGDWKWSAPQYLQGGNTLFDINETYGSVTGTDSVPALASDFNELNITAMLDIDRFFPTHFILWADYVKNLGYDKDEVKELNANIPDEALNQTEGYQVGALVGYPLVRNFGDWNCSLFYKYLEADAVLDALTDSDFHTGGTDAKGWILSGQYGLYKNVWLQARWLTANELIDALGQLAIDTVQVDINAEF